MSINPETRGSLAFHLTDGGNQQAWFEFVNLYQPVIDNSTSTPQHLNTSTT